MSAPATDDAETVVESLIALLTLEIEALRAGDIGTATSLAADKARLAGMLEAEQGAATTLKPERLATLRDLIARDAALLERVSVTAAGLSREIARIRDRHSLTGLYGRSGHKTGASGPAPEGGRRRDFDKSL